MRVSIIATLAAVFGNLACTPCVNAQNSATWSGYAVENGGSSTISYTEAGVSFALPNVSCPNTGLGLAAGASFWVGLDHGGSSPIEKAGITVTCDNTQTPPQPVYQAFWLMYVPGSPADVHLGFTAKPGDGIRAGITYANGSFQLTVTDTATGGQTLSSGPQPCAATGGCPRASVEWIVERPGDDVPLAGYGCVNTVCANQSAPPPGIILNDPVVFTPNATYSGPSQGLLQVLSMHELGSSGAPDGPTLSACLAVPIQPPVARGTEARGSGAVFTTLSGSFFCQWYGYGTAACDSSGCISEQTFCANIVKNFYNQQTNQEFVSGYAVLCGGQPPYVGGLSGADLNIDIASVTKTMTAVLALRLLGLPSNPTLNDTIFEYLPASWQQAIESPAKCPPQLCHCTTKECPVKNITFKALLEQKSGLCANGAPGPCQTAATNTRCGGEDTVDSTLQLVLQNVVDPNPSWHYDNCNFALFRALLPQFKGTGNPCIYNWNSTCPTKTAPTPAQSAQAAADFYVTQMNEFVFGPLGLPNIGCKPTSTATSMFGWPFPPTGNGWVGGPPYEPDADWTLACGGGGLNMSPQDVFAVLNDLANGQTLLTPALKAEMKADFLGWDNMLRPSGPPDACPGYVCKNGNIPGGGSPTMPSVPTQIWTYAGIVKCTVPVAIVVNSPLPPYYQPFPVVPAPPNAAGTDIIGLVDDALTGTPNILSPKACPTGSFH